MSNRNARALRDLSLLFCTLGALDGCAGTWSGFVERSAQGETTLAGPTGDRHKLVLLGEARQLGMAEDYYAEVEGEKWLGRIRVRDWKLHYGPRSLTVWTGNLESRGIQVGLLDRNSGGYYFIEEESGGELSEFIGKPVLIEGYVEGAHHVRVVYFRLLTNARAAE